MVPSRKSGSAGKQNLIAHLGKSRGRVATDVVNALRKISGKNFHDNAHLWKDWFKRRQAVLSPTVKKLFCRP